VPWSGRAYLIVSEPDPSGPSRIKRGAKGQKNKGQAVACPY